LTQKTYNGVSTPQAHWCYDGKTCLSGNCTGNEVVGEKGYATWAGNSASFSEYRHQELGLVRWSRQTTGAVGYAFEANSETHTDGYLYTQGRLTDVYYPSGRHVSYGYDAAGRINGVGGYVTGVLYAPSGAPSQVTLGNNVIETTVLNSELQVASIEAVRSGSLWKLENFFCAGGVQACASNNGNLVSQRLTVPATAGGPLSWPTAYEYDGVNRLKTATESPSSGTGWAQSFSYGDQFGNVLISGGSNVVPTGQICSSYNSANNRCNASGFQYDGGASSGPGNLTTMADRTMAYDAENRQVSLTDSGTTTLYSYDAEGRRVSKVTGGVATTYVYDAMGQLVAEYGGAGVNTAGCSRCYLTADHLGSTRLVTDAQGAVVSRHDYTPFGWEIGAGYGQRSQVTGYATANWVQPKFTGKPRDYESGLGLDYFGARYYSGSQGRFTTPDWSEKPQPIPYAHLSDPQTPNLYAYVRNSPLVRRDLDGHCGILGLFCKLEPVPRATPDPANTRTDPALSPVNRDYRLAVTSDSGGRPENMRRYDAREVTYTLQTADGNNVVGPNDRKSTVAITEHQSDKTLAGQGTGVSTSNGTAPGQTPGEFADLIGPGGDHHSPSQTSTRYFTVVVNGKLLGVIPITDQTGTHAADKIQIDHRNDATKLNGSYDPIDIKK
jgi:RHS repeat-associated protein